VSFEPSGIRAFIGYTGGMIQIEPLTQVSERAVHDLNALLPQLSDDVRPLTTEILAQVIMLPDRLIVAVDDGRIVGAVLLLVNNQLVRGQGVGGQLIEAAVAAAREAGAASIDITSKAQRSALYGMYEQHGFKRRDSALFRLPLSR
jgi:GNAT superfamily N-acetyltransferase